MDKKERLNYISSEYCLKEIFAFLDYNYLLKLIKYNNNLQKKLGIKIENYKNILSYQYVKRKIIRKTKYINSYELYENNFYISVITFAPLTYILVYSSILYFEGGFKENFLRENYNEKFLNSINKINTSLYLLEAFMLISFFVIVCFIFNNFYFDEPNLKIIKYKILLIIISFYCLYEIIIIYKIYLSYKIKNSNILPWFFICDFILIILLLLYITFMIYLTYKYIRLAGTGAERYNKTILKKFKNIDINDFELPDNFHNMTKQNKRKYLINNSNKFQYTHSIKNIHLINKINNFRIQNNLSPLAYSEEEKVPDFLIHEFSEEILFDYKNIFKLLDRKYLFKYKINNFEKNFDKTKIDLDVVLNEDINRISIIDVGEFEYIFLYDNINDDYKINLIEAKNSIPNKEIYDEIIEDLIYNE